MWADPEIAERVDRLEIPFNAQGYDAFGISKAYLATGFSLLGLLYKRYFRVKAFGVEHVPARGRAMLVGNHSGGVAIDGAMVLASMLLEKEPPRLAQGMAEKFINRLPWGGSWANRTGQLTGLPEHAVQLLQSDRLLMVFPEGARGTAKLYKDRYSLVNFGTGFMRLALQTRTPIIPFGFVGGGAAFPTVANLVKLGRAVGVPYLPMTPYLLPVPLPAQLRVYYGEPLHFSGTGREDDAVVFGYVEQVKQRVAELLDSGRVARRGELHP